MKKLLILFFFLIIILGCFAQEVLHLKNGSTVMVQNGVELTLQGGITMDTGNYYVFLGNNDPASLLNDATNTGYVHSWINGKFRRLITGNTSNYDFPVGNTTRCNLLQFLNNNIAGTNYLTASFGPKPGTDA